jgi:hypothetical protein
LFSGGGQGRGVGVVTRSRYGWPSATRRCDPGEVWPPSGWSPVARMSGRRPRRWSPCPRALSAVRTSESNRSSGRPVSTRPVSTRPVPCRCVRTDGSPVSAALQPRCPNRAGPWNGSVGGPPPLGQWVRRVAVVRGRRGRLPAWGLKGGMVLRWPWVARTRVDGGSGPPYRTRTGCGGASPPGRRGSWSSARVLVGWLGSTRTSGCSPVPPQVHLGRLSA